MRIVTLTKILTFCLIAVLITGYAYFKTINVIRGPEINISSPSIGGSVEKNLVTVKGQALRIAKLYLNGQQIFTDDAGNFTESLIAPEGYSTIHIEAVDIFSRKTITQIPITYNPHHG